MALNPFVCMSIEPNDRPHCCIKTKTARDRCPFTEAAACRLITKTRGGVTKSFAGQISPLEQTGLSFSVEGLSSLCDLYFWAHNFNSMTYSRQIYHRHHPPQQLLLQNHSSSAPSSIRVSLTASDRWSTHVKMIFIQPSKDPSSSLLSPTLWYRFVPLLVTFYWATISST